MVAPMPARRRNTLALLASCLVYAIPLPGAHAVPLLGTWLIGAVAGSGSNAKLGLATVALALVVQALTFLMARWILGGRRRWLALIPYVPALVVGTFVMTVFFIPRFVLIDRDTTPENLSWPVECSVLDASVHVVRSPIGGDFGRSGRTWLRMGSDASRFGLLHRDGCSVTELASPPPRGTMHAITYAAPVGAMLETTWDMPTQRQLSWWRRSPDSTPVELPPMPHRLDGIPILSDDGAWLVLIERPEPPPASPRVTLRRFDDGMERVVPLDGLERGSFIAVGATLTTDASGSLASGEIVVWRNDDEVLAIDLDGKPISEPFRPPGVDVDSNSFRRIDGGWAGWDSYVEDRPYAIAWETRTGRGSHVLPKGRGITSCDIDPSGRWIAYSTSAIYNLGGVHDDVIVISTADGTEVFRDAQPTYARSDVAFMGPGLLAYTAWDGGQQTEVRVVRAP
jgi:hypothetical protein